MCAGDLHLVVIAIVLVSDDTPMACPQSNH